MSAEKILDKASFLKGVEVGRTLRRWTGGVAVPEPEPARFQMKIDLVEYGRAGFRADIRGTFQIDWGDGVIESIDNSGTGGIEHTYPALDVYTITIDGDMRVLGHGAWRYNGLEAVVELLSPLPASLKSIYYAFSNCSGLTSIPPDLFSQCANLKSVVGCFSKSPITAIPSGLFAGCPNVTSFEACFSNCSAVTAIPAGLFDSCPNAETFDSCFLSCSAIKSVPAGLFDHCPKARSFASCFSHCSALTGLPEGLFQAQGSAERFTSCFEWCSKLASLPADLFDNCVAATEFDNCFWKCVSLKAVGSGLFANCTLAYQFNSCFSGCSALADVPSDLFDRNKITQLEECFMLCSKLSHAPELWVKFPDAAHTKCFRRCELADNYDQIPTDWI